MIAKLTVNWLLLVGLTLVAVFLGETADQLEYSLLMVILILAVFKSQILVDHFMGLYRVAGPWRWLLSLYAVLIFSIIAIIYSF